MRQIISSFRTGELCLEEVLAPTLEMGHVLIRTTRMLVSQGTEKMLLQFGNASLFQKAHSQPVEVRQVLGKIRTGGLVPTVDAVFRKLDEPLPLGYCNVGTVVGVGEGVTGFTLGDRVASNGPHAEIVFVPQSLVANVPGNVSEDASAFTVISAVGLQGLRLAKPELGERFVVIGLGLIGQITAQLLRAHGCRVIGFDVDAAKVDLACSFGVDAILAGGDRDPVKEVTRLTGGLGCDGVIITASAQSNQVIAQAVRDTMSRGVLNVELLITRRLPLERFGRIYNNMDGSGLTSLLVYAPNSVEREVTEDREGKLRTAEGRTALGKSSGASLNRRQRRKRRG